MSWAGAPGPSGTYGGQGKADRTWQCDLTVYCIRGEINTESEYFRKFMGKMELKGCLYWCKQNVKPFVVLFFPSQNSVFHGFFED